MMTDPIADMLTRIRNGYLAHKHEVAMPYSRVKESIAALLVAEGFVTSVEKVERTHGFGSDLKVRLKYPGGKPAITDVQRVSTPGHRQYTAKDRLPTVQSGFGVAIVSTSKGMMTNKQARTAGVGGELICTIW